MYSGWSWVEYGLDHICIAFVEHYSFIIYKVDGTAVDEFRVERIRIPLKLQKKYTPVYTLWTRASLAQ